jgi:hypothetical protein
VGLLCVAVVLGLEGIALHLVALNSVAPYYPRGFDQVQYLTESYQAYELLRDLGPTAGIAQAVAQPRVQGWLLQLEASGLFLLTGPTRLSALDVNVAHLLVFLAIGATLLRRRFGAGAALAFVGLALSTHTTTATIGGPFDFRLDFAAMCAWGTLVSVLALGGTMRRWPQFAAIVVAGAVLISVRTIAFVFLAGTVAVLFVLAPLALCDGQRIHTRLVRGRLLVALACWSATEALFAARNFDLLRAYYIGGHVVDAEKGVRALEVGAVDLLSSVVFYARTLAFDSLGRPGLILLGFVISIAVLLVCGEVLLSTATRSSSVDHADGTLRWPVTVLVIATVVPYLALSVDEVKSWVVAGVLVPPVLLLAVVALAGAASHAMWAPEMIVRRALLAVGALCLSLGVAEQVRDLRQQVLNSLPASDIARASSFINQMAQAVLERADGAPTVWAADAHLDFATAQVVRVYQYEQHRLWLPIVGGLGEGAIYATLTPTDVRSQADQSGVLILTRRDSAPPPVFPYDQSVEAAEGLLLSLADTEFDLRARDRFFEREVSGFVRRDEQP